ncbi:hypothetical protein KI387_017114, partial [Taxus chinensis]
MTLPIQGVGNEDPGDGIVKLKGNKIPKGLLSLEEIFHKNDMFIKEKEQARPTNFADYKQVNIGTKEKPRLVNI